ATVEKDLKLRPARLQAMHPAVIERRHVTVLLRAEALEPGFARMDDEGAATRFSNCRDEAIEAFLGVLIVDADAAFHRHWNRDSRAHRGDTLSNKLRLGHEAGAETSRLHAIRRAPDVEIDLVIAESGANPCGLVKFPRIASSELKTDRMLGGIKPKHAFPVAIEYRVRRHHLCVQERPPRQQPQEVAAVAVGPLHHRRDAKTVRVGFQRATLSINRFRLDQRLAELLAPIVQRPKHWAKRLALLRQKIFVARRMLLVEPRADHALGLKRLEPRRERVGSNTIQSRL